MLKDKGYGLWYNFTSARHWNITFVHYRERIDDNFMHQGYYMNPYVYAISMFIMKDTKYTANEGF